MGTETIQEHNCSVYEQAVKSSNPTNCNSLIPEIDKAVLDEIRSKYSQKCMECILCSLDADERRVIFFDEIPEMKDYCVFSKLKIMSEEEAERYDCYDALPEHRQKFMDLNRHWVNREKEFLLENLRRTYGREPSKMEIDSALGDEILRFGKSHAERFRVYFALAFPDKVRKVKKTIREIRAEYESNPTFTFSTQPADYVLECRTSLCTEDELAVA